MKIDVAQLIKNLEGQPMVDHDNNNSAVTLRYIATTALLQTYADEGNISGEEKFLRYDLASKFYTQKDVELNGAELELAKKLIGKLWPVNIVGPAFNALAQSATSVVPAVAPELPTDDIVTSEPKKSRRKKATSLES